MKRFPALVMMAALCLSCSTTNVVLTGTTVELQTKPMALHTPIPRFSWKYDSHDKDVRQLAYRVIVSTTAELASRGVGDVWDSEQITSADMVLIPYGGRPLKSRERVYWCVETTVQSGKAKPITLKSEAQPIEVSLLNKDDWQATWIGRDFNDDRLDGHTAVAARYLRKVFNVGTAVKQARLYISGLGQYSAFINGAEVAPDELFKPALSDYRKRVYFNAYDVTPMLKEGNNAMGIILEGGRYTAMRQKEGARDGMQNMLHYGTPRLLLQLEITYSDGHLETIVSDPSWHITNQGPIRKANEFDGETYNGFMEMHEWAKPQFDDSHWMQATVVDAPSGQLSPQPNPNLQVQDTLLPLSIFHHSGAWVVDMGQNMVGFLDLNVRGAKRGDTIVLRYAETLSPDSTLYTANLRTAEVTDTLILADTCLRWHPTFVYHGFRYATIEGLRREPSKADIHGLVVYDKMDFSGKFHTSNQVINAVYQNACWGIRGNYRSMPTDCPQRDERMGWTGDRTTGAYGESYIFNNHNLYSKWLTDFDDSQLVSGSLPEVVPPYWRFYSNSMTWPGAFITVADMLYWRFGDMRPIEQHYDAMKRWMLFMKDKYMSDGIMTKDTYGDWCMPPESLELIHSRDTNRITKAAVLSTPYYCAFANTMSHFASLLGKTDDSIFFQRESNLSKNAFNTQYFDPQTARYSNNTVTANLLPLSFKLVPDGFADKVFANVVDVTENQCHSHVSTGVIGIQHLRRTLTEYGRGDLALRIASNDTYPSWGYMYRNGATTIWELWNGNTANPAMNSGNHVMLLGDLIVWEYEYLAGIRPLKPGFETIQLKPYPITGLDSVSCSYNSVRGTIISQWTRTGNKFSWHITIPPNTTAQVYIPSGNGYRVETYGSGSYHIQSKL